MKNTCEHEQPTLHEANDAINELPLPYLEMDARGVITRANRATLALFPAGMGEMVGKPAWQFLAGDERDASSGSYARLMESGGDPPVIRRAIFDRSGGFRTYELHRSLMRSGDGALRGMRVVGIDVTEWLQTVEEARRAQHWLESALECSSEAMILTDTLGFVRFVNRALEELLGWKAKEMLGQVVEKALPAVARHSGCENMPCFNVTLNERMTGTATVLDREGRELKVEITTAPIVDRESGATMGVVAVLRRIE